MDILYNIGAQTEQYQWTYSHKYYCLNILDEYGILGQSLLGPELIKLISCSTQLSMEFFLLINVKMPIIVGILTFMSGKKSILCLSESEKS